MDSEIMAEEANLGDFKRATVRQWMGTKFGSLLECCEKGTVRFASPDLHVCWSPNVNLQIVGELGKLVISVRPSLCGKCATIHVSSRKSPWSQPSRASRGRSTQVMLALSFWSRKLLDRCRRSSIHLNLIPTPRTGAYDPFLAPRWHPSHPLRSSVECRPYPQTVIPTDWPCPSQDMFLRHP